jgi:hypothetical protein
MNRLIKILVLLLIIVLINKTGLINKIPIINEASRAKIDLQQEFAELSPLPSSTMINSDTSNKFIELSIQANYTSTSHWDEISNYYLHAATSNDWIPDENEVIVQKVHGEGQIMNFHKNNYHLSIESGSIQDSNQPFIITFKWVGVKLPL